MARLPSQQDPIKQILDLRLDNEARSLLAGSGTPRNDELFYSSAMKEKIYHS